MPTSLFRRHSLLCLALLVLSSAFFCLKAFWRSNCYVWIVSLKLIPLNLKVSQVSFIADKQAADLDVLGPPIDCSPTCTGDARFSPSSRSLVRPRYSLPARPCLSHVDTDLADSGFLQCRKSVDSQPANSSLLTAWSCQASPERRWKVWLWDSDRDANSE